MIIVIDAYNVLKQAHRVDYIAHTVKLQFIKRLGYYAKIKNHSLIAVFDGGSFEHPDKERIDGIQVIHSGIHVSADDWIKGYAQQHHNRDVLLVSTDRELNASVYRFGVQSIDAMDFYVLLNEALSDRMPVKKNNNYQIVKLSQDNIPSLDYLMEKSSEKIIIKREDIVPERTSKSRNMSKKEKLIFKKLKKL